jgi:hypothetical protein
VQNKTSGQKDVTSFIVLRSVATCLFFLFGYLILIFAALGYVCGGFVAKDYWGSFANSAICMLLGLNAVDGHGSDKKEEDASNEAGEVEVKVTEVEVDKDEKDGPPDAGATSATNLDVAGKRDVVDGHDVADEHGDTAVKPGDAVESNLTAATGVLLIPDKVGESKPASNADAPQSLLDAVPFNFDPAKVVGISTIVNIAPGMSSALPGSALNAVDTPPQPETPPPSQEPVSDAEPGKVVSVPAVDEVEIDAAILDGFLAGRNIGALDILPAMNVSPLASLRPNEKLPEYGQQTALEKHVADQCDVSLKLPTPITALTLANYNYIQTEKLPTADEAQPCEADELPAPVEVAAPDPAPDDVTAVVTDEAPKAPAPAEVAAPKHATPDPDSIPSEPGPQPPVTPEKNAPRGTTAGTPLERVLPDAKNLKSVEVSQGTSGTVDSSRHPGQNPAEYIKLTTSAPQDPAEPAPVAPAAVPKSEQSPQGKNSYDGLSAFLGLSPAQSTAAAQQGSGASPFTPPPGSVTPIRGQQSASGTVTPLPAARGIGQQSARGTFTPPTAAQSPAAQRGSVASSGDSWDPFGIGNTPPLAAQSPLGSSASSGDLWDPFNGGNAPRGQGSVTSPLKQSTAARKDPVTPPPSFDLAQPTIMEKFVGEFFVKHSYAQPPDGSLLIEFSSSSTVKLRAAKSTPGRNCSRNCIKVDGKIPNGITWMYQSVESLISRLYRVECKRLTTMDRREVFRELFDVLYFIGTALRNEQPNVIDKAVFEKLSKIYSSLAECHNELAVYGELSLATFASKCAGQWNTVVTSIFQNSSSQKSILLLKPGSDW